MILKPLWKDYRDPDEVLSALISGEDFQDYRGRIFSLRDLTGERRVSVHYGRGLATTIDLVTLTTVLPSPREKAIRYIAQKAVDDALTELEDHRERLDNEARLKAEKGEDYVC